MNQSNSNTQQLYQLASSSPLFQRAQQMADGKTSKELEQIAKNICEQKGISYDDAFRTFSQMFNNK